MHRGATEYVLDPTDGQLAEAIVRAIRRRCEPSLTKVRIAVSDGIACVAGTVRTFYHKQMMLHTALNVPGIQGVLDEIDVLPYADGTEATR